jgi:hypothetical protein
MPKDEFDFDDPLELNGVALETDEDTHRDMAECFVEEFVRLGYNHKQLLALFRNPHYLGMNMVLQNKGEAFVMDVIRDVFARWGRKIEWPFVAPAAGPRTVPPHLPRGEGVPYSALSPSPSAVIGQRALTLSEAADARFPLPEGEGQGEGERGPAHSCTCGSGGCSFTLAEQSTPPDDNVTDPLGNPVPQLNL